MFDEWQANPYTKVLQESIARDYIPISDVESMRKDAERYRHARAHGWPMSGPQCIAWTHDGRMVVGDTPEAALDAAMREF